MPARDLPNDESNAGKIMWTEPRVFAGRDGVVPKMGVGGGGGTLPWLGVMPRFQHAAFRTHSTEGVGERPAQSLTFNSASGGGR